MGKKFLYLFSEGDGNMRELLGGKGANLAEMTNLGMPVPQGFTITTEACTKYWEDGEVISPDLEDDIYKYIATLEGLTGKKFGDVANPLLVSVRSGARASMPGMMDTILNLGLNEEVAESIAKQSGNPRWAWDSYRRFIQMYSDVVCEVSKKVFEGKIDEIKKKRGVTLDTDLTADDLRELANQFKAAFKDSQGVDFPTNAKEQLLGAIKAVFRSWNNERAIVYRRENNIPGSWGTAVNVQSMVFGNMGDDSGTGVAFTRDPATGEKKLYGEFLMNAQGEDVVAGIRTPQTIDQLAKVMPEAYNQFVEISNKLEAHFRDMQDMEFTIEKGTLYMLQTRNGKRNPNAALRIAVQLVEEGMRTKEEALLLIDAQSFDAVLHPVFDKAAEAASTIVAKGLNASPGAGCGAVYFNAEDAVKHSQEGPVLLVRLETSPEDLAGMYAAQGILTARGGASSHAAVVARGAGICCVSGCGELVIDDDAHLLTIAGQTVKEGEYMSINGTTGNIYIGKIPTVEPDMGGDFGTVMQWADDVRRLRVRANADTPADAAKAVELGAEGIGLTRTEHMFFADDRIAAIREMIVSKTAEQRKTALDKLLPFQRADFAGIYRVMLDKPVTIRLLDPPLHEFLPHDDEDIKALATEMGLTFEGLKSTITGLHEANPMMGHRGCRLPVTYPEIAVMQTQAIIEAALEVKKETGADIVPEIMIPLVCEVKELKFVKDIVVSTADKLIAASGTTLKYHVGTMIEIPRAALLADEIATEAEFFSFGTNDLTQMTYGFSRDDAVKFLPSYYSSKIFEADPFQRLDQNGVGKLIETAVKLGKQTRPDIHLGVCGEHGGDPSSIEFCHKVGLSYVSCSPYRIPTARLAAAQAVLRK
ncbi:MAG: pyruvate, phosphate dikinase [Oscillospiraceae bacterium]|jgi:pyruvate,orthophosphate dikinase|nr:pyruvate, phosphate dikinase [Oscillospiraceae bacterium]